MWVRLQNQCGWKNAETGAFVSELELMRVGMKGDQFDKLASLIGLGTQSLGYAAQNQCQALQQAQADAFATKAIAAAKSYPGFSELGAVAALKRTATDNPAELIRAMVEGGGIAKATAKPAAREDEFAWLRRRVSEVSWKAAA